MEVNMNRTSSSMATLLRDRSMQKREKQDTAHLLDDPGPLSRTSSRLVRRLKACTPTFTSPKILNNPDTNELAPNESQRECCQGRAFSSFGLNLSASHQNTLTISDTPGAGGVRPKVEGKRWTSSSISTQDCDRALADQASKGSGSSL